MNFSIVIPTYNRPELLEKLVNSILNLDYDKDDFEVIIIDDGSTNNAINLTQKYQKSFNLRYYFQKNSGPSSARNTGIDIARGEYICFLDDDCIPPRDWLKKIHAIITETRADGICGISTDRTGNIFSTTSQFISNFLLKELNNYYKMPVFVMSNNLIYKREIFNKIDKFNLLFSRPGGEDRELNFRIIEKGYKVTFAKEIIIDHYHNLIFTSFLKQQFNYGIGSYLLRQIRIKSGWRKFNTPVQIYLKLVIKIIRSFKFPKNFVVLILFFLSQFTVIFGMFCKWFSPGSLLTRLGLVI
jgi:glycosyltransferase involved in cell wall biosynthesis